VKLSMSKLAYVDSADLFDKVADQPWAVMLDSETIDSRISPKDSKGYDVLAIKPHTTLVFDGDITHFRNRSIKQALPGDPLEILKAAIPEADNLAEIDVPYLPGGIGYFSYDLARQFEEIPSLAEDDENLPPLAIGIYYVVLVIDHRQDCSYLVQLGDSEETLSVVSEWRDLVDIEVGFVDDEDSLPANKQFSDHPEHNGGLVSGLLEESMDAEVYRKCFENVQNYIVDGDCYQVNLTKRFSVAATGNPWTTYRFLRQISPAPYGAYLNLPFAQVLSNSPESFIQCRERQVVTRPIKGTKPRALHNAAVDKAIAKGLQISVKDRAENLMIVDLMRNDLSRCCELYSVKVPALFELHSFANVHHLVSTVTGVLKPELHSLDLLRSCFPGGSITGAPKIRAMEIIEEMEPYRRGLYCGAIGYLGCDGSLETSIAIRTIVYKDGVARYCAGGGIVDDSKLDSEYQELLDKARMMTNALFP